MPTLFSRALLVAAMCVPAKTVFAGQEDVAELRQVLREMKQHYESRISELEQRLQAVEQQATESALAAAGPAVGGGSAARLPSGRSSASAFNPAISMVVQGSAADYSGDVEEWALPGFQLGGESGLHPEGLSVTETELIVSANVDNLFYAQSTVGIHEDEGSTEVDLEEAFVDVLNMPAGLGLRFGRFFPEVGYVNTQHTHAWDFADAPLTSQAFLGQQYRDDGVRLTWLAPTETYFELGVEALRGDRFPASGDGADLFGDAQNWFARVGWDLNDSHSVLLGVSHLRSDSEDRQAGHAHGHEEEEEETFSFGGDSDLSNLSLVWKWAPLGNPRARNFVFQGEFFHRDEDGEIAFANDVGEATLPYDGEQKGIYAQGVYQFMPRWRTGLRYDKLWSDNDLAVVGNTSGEGDDELLEESGLIGEHDPWRWSWMVDYSHSEFSRLRLQFVRDHSQSDAENQFLLQYIHTLGAHGAHKY